MAEAAAKAAVIQKAAAEQLVAANERALTAERAQRELVSRLDAMKLQVETANANKSAAEAALKEVAGLTTFSLALVRSATREFHDQCKIGSGGFGDVFRAQLPIAGEGNVQVAIKRLKIGIVQSSQHFKNELALLSRLRGHKNIVGVVGYACDETECCIVTTLFPRGSLQRVLQPTSDGRLAFTALARVGALLDTAHGLTYLHAQNVWHLDLKPDNVLAAEDGSWALIDFGLARRVGDLKLAQTHKSTRSVMGTPGFIAKEFMEVGHMSGACDVYSFGVLVLVVLSGLPVYADGEHVRDRVEIALEEVKVPEDVTSSGLTTCSCDWGFPGGSELLLDLLKLGVKCSNPMKAKRPSSMPSVEQTLQESMSRLEAALVKECLICMDAPRAAVLEPCRHAVACVACTRQLMASRAPCPVCRVPVQAVEAARAPVLNTFVRR